MNIRKQQAEGIAAARLRGIGFGRPEAEIPDNFGSLMKKIEKHQITIESAVNECTLSSAAFYRRLREYRLQKKFLHLVRNDIG